jgi:pimeloyl-ACP methyl ester carboxylesterase
MTKIKKPSKKKFEKGASIAQTTQISSVKNNHSSSMKTLHALVIAIDKYPVKGHELHGCVNDATAFANYLKEFCQKSGITYSEKRLFDADAARLKIVEGFKHFAAAKDGDTCVYYYSGHGSTMPAPAEFWDEPDKMSQTVVCYDSRTGNLGCRDMADKEIGYLIHSATKGRDVHFLAVTDCCHSGTNTRDVAAKDGLKARMTEACPTAPRAIDYLGFKEWKNFQPPSSNHVHLAAAKNDETAKECKIEGTSRGVFTYSLIETLQQMNGNISYAELMQRVSIKAKNRVVEQTPQLNAYGPTNTQDIRLSFLGFTEPQGGNFLVSFSDENGWTVNAGGVQGLPKDGETEFEMENGMKVTTTSVLSNFSKINLELPSTNSIFNAKLTSPIKMSSRPVRFAMSKDSDAEAVKTMKVAFDKAELKSIQVVDNERDTDYVIRAWDGAYRLTTVDNTAPLFKRVTDLGADGAREFLNRCLTVVEWRNRLEIANPATSIKEEDVSIVFYDATGKALDLPAFDKNGKAADTTPIFRQANKDAAVYCQLSIENKSNRTLWVSSVYFGSDFSISNTFLRPQQVNAGQKTWMQYNGKPDIPLWLPLEYLSWGVNETLEYFKIFVSTDKLDTDIHNQNGLPLDTKNAGTNRLIREGTPMQDWRTFDRPFRTVSPMLGQTLAANAPRKLNDVEITAPTGFSAKVNLSSTSEAKRALGDKPFPQMRGNDQLENGAFAEGMGFSAPLDVLEISAVTGAVSKANPLKIKFLTPTKPDELLVPLGYDKESGLYLPLGSANTEESLLIENLPSESPTGERGFGSSFKIFLKKMIVKPLTGEFDYPLLQVVNYSDNPEIFTYGTDKEDLKKRVEAAKKIVLFIHGFAGSTSELPKSLRRNVDSKGKNLADSYDLALTFNYESINTPIERTAEMLESNLAEVGLKAGHGKQFHIVAHSMGGLVSRWFIERRSGKNVVNQLVMLGTPNAGSAIPALHDSFQTLFTMLVNGVPFLNAWSTPISWLGKAVETAMVTVKQQAPNSPFFQQLNESPDAGVPYRIIVGNTQLLLTPKKDVEGTFSKIYQHFKSRKMFAVSDTFFGEANDMVVPDASIGSAGLQKNVKIEVIPAYHFSYFVPEADGLKALATFVE